jgi:hypothetical protein
MGNQARRNDGVFMSIICFELSMPSNNSWNGKWTGDGVFYARTRSFNTKASKEKAAAILAEEYFTYRFGDGWVARLSVREVTATEKRKIDRKTKGFCGYDWMIDSILRDGEILATPRKSGEAA